jgi:hypothetical protein
MSDIPDCRRCGCQLRFDEHRGFWTCPNNLCMNYQRFVRGDGCEIPEP